MHRTRATIGFAVVTAAAVALVGCSADDGGDGNADSIRIVYQKTDGFVALDNLFQKVKPEFEAANPGGVTVELEPIVADEGDYGTKLALMQQSADTAPDVFYEDTFRVRSDVDAGYLLNLDDHLADWDEWSQFNEGAREAGRADDGSVYAVPLGTDTRGIWYSKSVLEPRASPCRGSRRRGTTSSTRPARSRPPRPTRSRSTSTQASPRARARSCRASACSSTGPTTPSTTPTPRSG